MARITEKDVHQAAAELDAQGIKPTTSKIREKLGAGSFSTIGKFLESYEAPENLDETPETPPELAAILPSIWAKAWEIATAKFEGERMAYESQLKALADELVTVEKIVEKQDEQIEEMAEALENEKKWLMKSEDERKKLVDKAAYLAGQLDIMRQIFPQSAEGQSKANQGSKTAKPKSAKAKTHGSAPSAENKPNTQAEGLTDQKPH